MPAHLPVRVTLTPSMPSLLLLHFTPLSCLYMPLCLYYVSLPIYFPTIPTYLLPVFLSTENVNIWHAWKGKFWGRHACVCLVCIWRRQWRCHACMPAGGWVLEGADAASLPSRPSFCLAHPILSTPFPFPPTHTSSSSVLCSAFHLPLHPSLYVLLFKQTSQISLFFFAQLLCFIFIKHKYGTCNSPMPACIVPALVGTPARFEPPALVGPPPPELPGALFLSMGACSLTFPLGEPQPDTACGPSPLQADIYNYLHKPTCLNPSNYPCACLGHCPSVWHACRLPVTLCTCGTLPSAQWVVNFEPGGRRLPRPQTAMPL